jgi:hypothetical protein
MDASRRATLGHFFGSDAAPFFVFSVAFSGRHPFLSIICLRGDPPS